MVGCVRNVCSSQMPFTDWMTSQISHNIRIIIIIIIIILLLSLNVFVVNFSYSAPVEK